MKHSVIVPVFVNKPEQISMTLRCLDLARSKTSLKYELIIIETLSDHFSSLGDVYVREGDRHHSRTGRAFNRGIALSRGEFVTILSNDVFVEEGWLEALEECFSIPDCGASTLASSQFSHKRSDKIEEGNWWAVATVRKSTYNMIGLFDEEYKGTWNDTDWLFRLYLSELKMYRNFKVVVGHTPGTTEYNDSDHEDNFLFGRDRFREKFSMFTSHPKFNLLAWGA